MFQEEGKLHGGKVLKFQCLNTRKAYFSFTSLTMPVRGVKGSWHMGHGALFCIVKNS